MKIDIRDDTRPIPGLLAGRAMSRTGDAFEHRLRAATGQADLVLVATSDDGLVGVLSAATVPLRADAAATRPDDVTVGQNRRWCWLTLPSSGGRRVRCAPKASESQPPGAR